MLHTTSTHIEIYKVEMTNVEDNFNVKVEVSRVTKPNLIFFQTLATNISSNGILT